MVDGSLTDVSGITDDSADGGIASKRARRLHDAVLGTTV